MLHLYTGYKITDKPISDMTPLQYRAILEITSIINDYKMKNKKNLMVVV